MTLSSLLAVVAAALFAPLVADAVRRVRIPIPVVEISLGILIGPQVLGLAQIEPVVVALADFGLAFLFFLAGFELDVDRIRGRPLGLAALGWAGSLLLAAVIGAAFQLSGLAADGGGIYVGVALATTALGTLVPILRDEAQLETRFGTQVLAVGAIGEFGPVVLMALLLSTRNTFGTALLLNAFVLIVLAVVFLAQRWRPTRVIRLIQQTMHSSGQVAIRLCVFILVGMVFLASIFGIDVLLGAFAAGLVVGQAVNQLDRHDPDVESLQAKFEGIGFGLLIPIFFIVSGMQFDLRGLLSGGWYVLLVPVFAACFVVVRGVPTGAVSGRELAAAERWPLMLLAATGLPLVIAITDRGVAEGQLSHTLATALVGAGMVSVFVFPLLALHLRRRSLSD